MRMRLSLTAMSGIPTIYNPTPAEMSASTVTVTTCNPMHAAAYVLQIIMFFLANLGLPDLLSYS